MMLNPGGGPDPPHFVMAVTTRTSAVPLQETSASASAMSPPSPVVPNVGIELPDIAIVAWQATSCVESTFLSHLPTTVEALVMAVVAVPTVNGVSTCRANVKL